MRGYFLYIAIVFCNYVFSQIYGYKPFWSYTTQLSTSHFLSDLGCKNGNGTNDFLDLDLNQTRFSAGAGINYNLPLGLSFGLNSNYIRLAADDAETQSSRTPRMIKIKTDIVESNLILKYTFPQKTNYVAGVYFFAGFGMAYYQPKAEWNDVWYNLRELGTEGQLADPTKEVYSTFSPTIPFGVGKKFYFYNGISLSADFNFRKSFTDYLDDVSTTYYDNQAIINAAGVAAGHFANPSTDPRMGKEGNIRGHSDRMDNYFLIGCQLEVPIQKYQRRGRTNLFHAYNAHWFEWFGKKRN